METSGGGLSLLSQLSKVVRVFASGNSHMGTRISRNAGYPEAKPAPLSLRASPLLQQTKPTHPPCTCHHTLTPGMLPPGLNAARLRNGAANFQPPTFSRSSESMTSVICGQPPGCWS